MILAEIGQLLQDAGLGTLGTNLFLGQLPTEPDTCLAVLEYEGEAPEWVQNSTMPAVERPRFQVVARAADPLVARANARSAFDVLNSVRNETLGGTWYVRVEALQSPFPLTEDPDGRLVVACNYATAKAGS